MTQQNQSTNWKTVSAVLLGTVLVLSVVIGVILYTQSIKATGVITPVKTVGCAVYADGAGTQPLTQINWGSTTPDSAMNVTIWIKNTGNVPVNYTISTSNFSPSGAQNYIGLTYDLKGAFNSTVGSIIPVVLTESISSSAPVPTNGVINYQYTITITASG